MTQHLTDAWFRLMTDAMRGTGNAQEAFKQLSQLPTTPEALMDWAQRFMPPGAIDRPESFEVWLEHWYTMMGVVPRSRYLELLEENDRLRQRLRDAERAVEQVRSMIGVKGQEEEAKKVLDFWGTMMDQAIKTQSEWLRAWPGLGSTGQPGGPEEPESENNKG